MKIEKNFFIENMKEKTRKLSVHVTKISNIIKSEPGVSGIYKLLIKNATCIGINYRAAVLARSQPEFYNKVHLAVEKADATLFLVEVLLELKSLKKDEDLMVIQKETKEIMKILIKTKSSPLKLKQKV